MTTGPSASSTVPRRPARRVVLLGGALGLVAALLGYVAIAPDTADGTALPATSAQVGTGSSVAWTGLVAPLEAADGGRRPVPPPGGAGGAISPAAFGVGSTTSGMVRGSETDPVTSIARQLRTSLARADRSERIPADTTPRRDRLRADARPLRARCTAEPGESRHEVCVVGDPDGQRTVAMVGSSHAMMWLPGLRAEAKRAGVRLTVFVKYGCSPFTFTMRRQSLPWTECDQWRDWALESIAEQAPDLVLVGSHTWVDIATPSGDSLTGDQRDDAWAGGVTGLMRRLAPVMQGGGEVVVIGDTTRRDLDPVRCSGSRRASFERCEQRITLEAVRINDLTRSAALGAGASYYDPGELVCQEARCPVAADGRYLFRDSLGHVSATYARHLGPALAQRVGLVP